MCSSYASPACEDRRRADIVTVRPPAAGLVGPDRAACRDLVDGATGAVAKDAALQQEHEAAHALAVVRVLHHEHIHVLSLLAHAHLRRHLGAWGPRAPHASSDALALCLSGRAYRLREPSAHGARSTCIRARARNRLASPPRACLQGGKPCSVSGLGSMSDSLTASSFWR